VAILLKGYPRISESFIAREILALQERGLAFIIVSLRRPTDRILHDLHERITAPVLYLPEYLHDAPLRVLRGLRQAARLVGFGRALRLWLADLLRDPSRNRVRRFGQAAVLAAEAPPEIGWLYAHFMHTPGSVARYAAAMRRLPFSLSAHAKDIWTTQGWEKRAKLAEAAWTVTCTALGAAHLRHLAPGAEIELLYHGVDTARFRPAAPEAGPVRILSVARCVPKKGLTTLLEALALLPPELPWAFSHIGDGPLRGSLEKQAWELGLAGRVRFEGPLPQLFVAERLRQAQIFCLPARIAADGDRDGLPNVLLEAMASGLAVVSTPVSAIPEAVHDGVNGLLVPPDDPPALAAALHRLLADAALRRELGRAARATVLQAFSETAGTERLAARFGLPLSGREAA
jgi:glycosyltransferase involved in cell wall biosynthesis